MRAVHLPYCRYCILYYIMNIKHFQARLYCSLGDSHRFSVIFLSGIEQLFFCRMLMGLEFALIVWITPKMKSTDGTFPAYYYGLVLFSYAVHQVCPQNKNRRSLGNNAVLYHSYIARKHQVFFFITARLLSMECSFR